MSRAPSRHRSLSSPADTRLSSPAAFPGGARQVPGSLGWLWRLELHASAGGNIAAAATLVIRDRGLPLPAAVALLTPEVDLTESGDTFQTNALLDVTLKRGLPECNALYARGHDLADPYVSPLFADFGPGFAPTFIQSGTRDLFLSNRHRTPRGSLRLRLRWSESLARGAPAGRRASLPTRARERPSWNVPAWRSRRRRDAARDRRGDWQGARCSRSGPWRGRSTHAFRLARELRCHRQSDLRRAHPRCTGMAPSGTRPSDGHAGRRVLFLTRVRYLVQAKATLQGMGAR